MNLRRVCACAALLFPLAAQASFLSGDALDSAANVLSWVIIFLVPAIGIALFWIVHVMPEKIAEKRHHPQKDSIKVLCILSLFFGGMLWPIAWLWAYTRPVVHRAVYGTEKHEDYYLELGDLALAGAMPPEQLAHLRAELAAMEAKGMLSLELKELAQRLDTLPAARAAPVLPANDGAVVAAATGGTR
jgi:CBS domain containing-hemolysin-like protein